MICSHCHETIEDGQPNELVHFRGWGVLVRVHSDCVKVSPIQPVEEESK